MTLRFVRVERQARAGRSRPPPFPVALIAIYTPVCVANLIVRYGVYHAVVAPLDALFERIE
jgi:hypothetical protein